LFNYRIISHLAYAIPYDIFLSNGIKVARGCVEPVLIALDTAICHRPPIHNFRADIKNDIINRPTLKKHIMIFTKI